MVKQLSTTIVNFFSTLMKNSSVNICKLFGGILIVNAKLPEVSVEFFLHIQVGSKQVRKTTYGGIQNENKLKTNSQQINKHYNGWILRQTL